MKNKLLTINQIIKSAEDKGVNFGKGNPYHRLRYYTKIGLLPNMVRRGSVGHYPKWVVERLVEIEDLKRKGYSNDEIKKIFKKRVISINVKEIREKVLPFLTFLAVFSILLILILDPDYKKGLSLLEKDRLSSSAVILKTGRSEVPAGKNKVFVYEEKISEDTLVHVTFHSSYLPAKSYYVSKIVPGKGFELTLDSSTAQDSYFAYFLSKLNQK